LTLLTKPFAMFLLLPLPYLFMRSLGFSFFNILFSFICLCITVFPFMMWRQWITQFPEGIPAYTWLFNEGNIRFKGAWLYWIFAERIAKLILGYWGVVFLLVGIILKEPVKHRVLVILFFLGVLSYLTIIARGNVQHDYYQILIIPVIAIFLGRGLYGLLHPSKGFSRFTSRIAAFIIMLFTVAFSWYSVRGFYWINRPEIIEAGNAVDRLVPKDAKVIAPYNGDTTFLYHTNRQGWPIGFDIEKKIAQGATHYVTVNPSDNDAETKDLAERFTVIVRNEKFAIIDLTKLR
ncbi:MAG: hypothetical protein N3A54_05560, partial [Patescibacteria group bacterium]|nr:hypothetical protein [Patescibacteria group bacterium]